MLIIPHVPCCSNSCVRAGVKVHAVDPLIGEFMALICVLIGHLINHALPKFLGSHVTDVLVGFVFQVLKHVSTVQLSPDFSVILSSVFCTFERR